MPSEVLRDTFSKVRSFVKDAEIVGEVYTDEGAELARYPLKDLIRLKPPNKHWMEPIPLTLSLFVGD